MRTVAGIGRAAGSPLAEGADEMFAYGSKETVWEPKQVLLAYLAHGLLTATGDQCAEAEEVAAQSYAALPGILPAALRSQDEALAQIAAKIADEPVIYVLGSGPNEDVARCLAPPSTSTRRIWTCPASLSSPTLKSTRSCSGRPQSGWPSTSRRSPGTHWRSAGTCSRSSIEPTGHRR